MSDQRLTLHRLAPIDVWVTANVHIFRQLGMWQDLKKEYVFVPARKRGFVVIAKPTSSDECKPVKIYELMRPAGLELSWHIDKTVNFRELPLSVALHLHLDTPERLWVTVGGSDYC